MCATFQRFPKCPEIRLVAIYRSNIYISANFIAFRLAFTTPTFTPTSKMKHFQITLIEKIPQRCAKSRFYQWNTCYEAWHCLSIWKKCGPVAIRDRGELIGLLEGCSAFESQDFFFATPTNILFTNFLLFGSSIKPRTDEKRETVKQERCKRLLPSNNGLFACFPSHVSASCTTFPQTYCFRVFVNRHTTFWTIHRDSAPLVH